MKFKRLFLYGYDIEYNLLCEQINNTLNELEKLIDISHESGRLDIRDKAIKFGDILSKFQYESS